MCRGKILRRKSHGLGFRSLEFTASLKSLSLSFSTGKGEDNNPRSSLLTKSWWQSEEMSGVALLCRGKPSPPTQEAFL